MRKQYLKSTIIAEPLIWKWYAWPYLISPATAGCNIVERHLKIMQSYVQNPAIHAQAMRNPLLIGGPFIDLDGQHTETIENMVNETNVDCADLIALHTNLKEFDKILQQTAKGDSLESLYSRVPDQLKGMVELVYDLNGHPSIRLIEPLIYKKYYNTKDQVIALSSVVNDSRKFVLSTPRIEQGNEIYLRVPFSSPDLDILFKMKETPTDRTMIKELFDIPSEKSALFDSFFTDEPRVMSKERNFEGDGVRVRYYGHACILVESKDISILVDPVISYPVDSNNVARFTLNDLPDKIDYVVITHNHQDHVMFETLLQLRHKISNIVIPKNLQGSLQDPSLKLILNHIGFSSVIDLNEFDEIDLPDGKITGLPFFGEHADLNIQSKLSYFLMLKGRRFMFLADSNNLEAKLYEHISNEVGELDILFIGMECDGAPLSWLYGPLLTQPIKRNFDNNRRLSGSNSERAWKIIEKIKSKKVYVYAMGMEPWLSFISSLAYTDDSPQIIESNKFIKMCCDKGIESKRLYGRDEWIFLRQ